MSRFDPAHEASACTGKVSFQTLAMAETARGHRKGGRQIYRCKFCCAYHVGTGDTKPVNNKSKRLFDLRALEAYAK